MRKARTVNNTTKQNPERVRQRRQRALERERARKSALRRRKLRTWALPTVLLLAVALGIVFAVATRKPAPLARAEASPVRGVLTAPVVLAAYEDFQCPSCGAFARQVMPELIRRYVDTGRVRIEWHDFAWYGPESTWAANAARCAGDQGNFWEYHDYLYDHQAGQNRGAFARSHLKEFGRDIGLDTATFDSCVDREPHLGAVRADMKRVQDLNLVGTPSFFVNGRQVSASPRSVFGAIEAALAG